MYNQKLDKQIEITLYNFLNYNKNIILQQVVKFDRLTSCEIWISDCGSLPSRPGLNVVRWTFSDWVNLRRGWEGAGCSSGPLQTFVRRRRKSSPPQRGLDWSCSCFELRKRRGFENMTRVTNYHSSILCWFKLYSSLNSKLSHTSDIKCQDST